MYIYDNIHKRKQEYYTYYTLIKTELINNVQFICSNGLIWFI